MPYWYQTATPHAKSGSESHGWHRPAGLFTAAIVLRINYASIKSDLDSGISERADLHELVRLLAVTSRRMRGGPEVPAALKQAFADGALGPRHMPPLFSLARSGPTSVGELAQRLDLAPATASLLVNELSRVGLVERREDDNDRRRTIVSVPDQHRRLIMRLAKHRIALMQRTLDRLEPDARRHFVAGLRILAEESAAASTDGRAERHQPIGTHR